MICRTSYLIAFDQNIYSLSKCFIHFVYKWSLSGKLEWIVLPPTKSINYATNRGTRRGDHESYSTLGLAARIEGPVILCFHIIFIGFVYSLVLIPWEERIEAFPIRVHLILLYIIRISLSSQEIFVYLDGGWWVGCHFWSLSSPIWIIYTATVYIYLYTYGNHAEQK